MLGECSVFAGNIEVISFCFTKYCFVCENQQNRRPKCVIAAALLWLCVGLTVDPFPRALHFLLIADQFLVCAS